MPSKTSTASIRELFLSYFEKQNHTRVPSSSLIPDNDPTLLFTNAGMVQFKDVFLGDDQLGFLRATSSQRCVRAGGKHNDLENVGYTARHHTFFEMLGNFSFGDYFKSQAIPFAWNFLTNELGISPEKLWVTIYEEDDEAYSIWSKTIGLMDERIIKIGDNKGARYESDNFWSMGDTGPCGPCTEIFYDHGEHIQGDLPGTPEEDGDRFIEIWNIVFMQYNRTSNGEMLSLPKPSVDTGMGLERISAVMQNVNSNYEIDIFKDLILSISKIINVEDSNNSSLRVIADHIRSTSFLICDGIAPSNEGPGYVLRRIIRRAVRHGHKLGLNELFFWKVASPLEKIMSDAYPELTSNLSKIEKILKAEENQFLVTLDQGMKILEKNLENIDDNIIPGELVFKLYDTYGFPFDLTEDIAKERGLTLDKDGYDKFMAAQKNQAKASSQFKDSLNKLNLNSIPNNTSFTGYVDLQNKVKILGLFVDGKSVDEANEPQEAVIILDNTPFYAESGGQVGDRGRLQFEDAIFDVLDTRKQGEIFLHHGLISKGSFSIGDEVIANVEDEGRLAITLNHSATHLLHAALRNVLGDHVVQKGSLVEADRLRFDFSHPEPVSAESIRQINNIVNIQIRKNTKVDTSLIGLDEAKEAGAMALFGEKYNDQVRVLSMGENNFSVELCGGTHVNRTGDIGLMIITAEYGIASGVRRIEAVTGNVALNHIEEHQVMLTKTASLLKSDIQELPERVDQLLLNQKKLEKQLEIVQKKISNQAGSNLISGAEKVGNIKILVEVIEGCNPSSLRDVLDEIKQKISPSVIILAALNDKRISLVASVDKSLTKKIKAGDIIKSLCTALGGKGGGKPDFAQGAGVNQLLLKDEMDKTKKNLVSIFN